MSNIMRRDLMNNPKMRDEASRMAAEENILSCIKVSDKANATYGLDDFNRGMLWAVTLGSSVARWPLPCGTGLRMLSGRKPTTAPLRLMNGSMAFFPRRTRTS